MDRQSWHNRVMSSLEAVASENYQSETWFGTGSVVSSYDEVVCNLLDDSMFIEYIEENATKFPADVLNLARQLRDMIRDLPDELSTASPKHVLKNPAWKNIRTLAAEVKRQIQKSALTDD